MSGNITINSKTLPHVTIADTSGISLGDGLSIAEHGHELRLVLDNMILGTFLANSQGKYLIPKTANKSADKIDLEVIESIEIIDKNPDTLRVRTTNGGDADGLDLYITGECPIPNESGDEPFDDKGRFQANAYARQFIKRHHIIKIDGCLHCYDGTHYVRVSDERLRGMMIDDIDSLSMSQRQEVLYYIKDSIRADADIAPDRYISFRNGIYDRMTDKMLPLDPTMVMVNQVPWDYNPDAEPVEDIDKLLSDWACGDHDVTRLLQEIIGLCMCRSNPCGKIFVLLGDKKNGKSTYLRMIAEAVGRENVSYLSLQDLEQKYRVGMIQGKTANLGDDIPDIDVADASMMKRIATGDTIISEWKHEQPVSFVPYITPIFSANVMPKISDPTGAIKRRLYPVPFKNVFDAFDCERMRIDELMRNERAMTYLIRLGIEGLQRAESDGLSCNNEIDDELTEIDMMNNPVNYFISEYGKDEIIDQPMLEVYEDFKDFCYHNGIKANIDRISFVKRVNSKLGTESKRYGRSQVKYFRIKSDE